MFLYDLLNNIHKVKCYYRHSIIIQCIVIINVRTLQHLTIEAKNIIIFLYLIFFLNIFYFYISFFFLLIALVVNMF